MGVTLIEINDEIGRKIDSGSTYYLVNVHLAYFF
jgi:hypothetical protein